MAEIHKLEKDGQTIWPATTTSAIIDAETKVVLEKVFETWNLNVLWPSNPQTNITSAITFLATKITAARQKPGTRVEFLNTNGENETWEYIGGTLKTFTDITAWVQVGGKVINNILETSTPVVLTFTVDKDVIEVGKSTPVKYSWKAEQAGVNISSECKFSIDGDYQGEDTYEKSFNLYSTKREIISKTLTATYLGKDYKVDVEILATQPTLYGVIDTSSTVNEALVKGVSGSELLKSNELEVEGINLEAQRYLAAFPSGAGELSSIKDGNGLEYLTNGGFKYTSSIVIDDVRYNVYYLETPVTGKGFKFIFS